MAQFITGCTSNYTAYQSLSRTLIVTVIARGWSRNRCWYILNYSLGVVDTLDFDVMVVVVMVVVMVFVMATPVSMAVTVTIGLRD